MKSQVKIQAARRLLKLARGLLAASIEYGDKVKDSVTGIQGWAMEERSGPSGKMLFINMNRRDEDGAGYWQEVKNLRVVSKADAEWI